MKLIKYKNISFPVKENCLGVGKELAQLNNKLDDDEFIEPLWIYKLPEYKLYSAVINEITVIRQDRNASEMKLKSAKLPEEKKRFKAMIEKADIDLNKAIEKLKDPILSITALKLARVNKLIMFRFKNDIDNIKAIAGAVLDGDISQIDFDKSDKDLQKLSNELVDVFFSIRNRIYSELI